MADLKLLRKVFDNLDLDKNETLSLDEVQMGLHKLGFTLSIEEINEQLFQVMDHKKNGKITFKDFVRFVENRSKEFKEMFMDISETQSTDVMYTDDDVLFRPTISQNDIRSYLNKFQIKATDKQIDTFLELVDEDSQGVISFEEFQAFFALLPRANPAAVFEAFKYTSIYEHANDLYQIIYQYTQFHLTPKKEELRLPRQVGRDENKDYNLYKLGSGAIAGFISRTVTAPFDRLRMMMQFRDPGSEKLGFWRGLKEIYLQDGIKGYFKGNGINCMKKVPEIAIKFYVFDFLLEKFSIRQHTTTMTERIISGGIAGGVGQFLVYPMEIARVRFALAPTGYYTSFFDCIHKIITQEGVTKLYSGLTPTLIGIFPYAGIDIGVYSFIKLQYCKYYQNQQKEPTVGNLLFSGMVASAIAMVATAPINIIRTRLQGNGLLPIHKRYKGPIDATIRTFQREGIYGFYRGTWPALIKVMPATSISYVVYEKLNQLVKHRQNQFAEAI